MKRRKTADLIQAIRPGWKGYQNPPWRGKIHLFNDEKVSTACGRTLNTALTSYGYKDEINCKHCLGRMA
jgi:hypothetical protein